LRVPSVPSPPKCSAAAESAPPNQASSVSALAQLSKWLSARARDERERGACSKGGGTAPRIVTPGKSPKGNWRSNTLRRCGATGIP